MTSKLFLIYFYFTFSKNSLNATLNNKLNLNKTKLKFKKKLDPKFKPVGPFSFFFPRLFIFFPTHCSSSSLTHIHRRRTPPFVVFTVHFGSCCSSSTMSTEQTPTMATETAIEPSSPTPPPIQHQSTPMESKINPAAPPSQPETNVEIEGIVEQIVEEINDTHGKQNEPECPQAPIRNPETYTYFSKI